MSETSMYETLMELPMFHGASYDQISRLIEKSHLEFNVYDPGDEIIALNSRCQSAKCIISGEALLMHPVLSGSIIVRELAGKGRCLGLERLFGLNNNYPFRVMAVSRCGTLDISKAQYMKLLCDDQIYLINSLNYTSRSAQKCVDLLIHSKDTSVASALFMIVDLTTSKESRYVSIESTKSSVADAIGKAFNIKSVDFQSLVREGVIECPNLNKVKIIDRKGLYFCANRKY